MTETEAPPQDGESEETPPQTAVADSERADAHPHQHDETLATEASFDDFNLSDEVRRALVDVGYERPMKVQAAVFEQLAAGRDIMVESRTGSGKTAAFGIPMIEMLRGLERGVSALILAPTRELAKQVADEITRLAAHTDVDVMAVYGGAAMGPQTDALKSGVKIVAGTPGRVLDHIRRKNFKTDHIKMLVLDECDEMLSMGFAEEIENIINLLPAKEDRQTLLFSATIPDDIVRIGSRHLTDPVTVSLSKDGIGAVEIDHFYYLVTGMARTRDLLKVVLEEKPDRALIFCNTRDDTAVVARYLAKNGFDAEAISGDLSQREREKVMSRMRDQTLRFLVATDVAARGIDLSDLSHVINYQFPESAEVYVHRTGRTGRAGNKGTALSLVGPRELGSFYYLKLIYKIRPEERDLPPSEELQTMLENHQLDRITKLVTETPNDKWVSLAKRVWESDDGERIIGALLERLLVAETSVERDRTSKRDREWEEGGGSGGRRRSRRDRNDRDRDRDRDRGEDGRRRRRRRRRRDEDGERSEASEAAEATEATEASEATSEAPAEAAEATTDGAETATDGAETAADGEEREATDGDGAPKKRRRRRRRRKKAEASADDGREFWETWADEKSDDADGGSADDGEAKADGEREAPSGTRLYVNIGKREEVTTDDIRELIAGFIGDGGSEKIASIALRNTHCYVRVPDDVVQTIIDASEGKEYRERELLIEKARR